MLAAYTELNNAQAVKEYLISKSLLNREFLPVKEFDGIYFPISRRARVPKAKVVDAKITFNPRPGKETIEGLLRKKLSPALLNLIPKSQEVVGDILILEVPAELEKVEKLIAEAYLKLLPNIQTVVKKDREHSGIYRTRGVKVLAGKKKKETIHLESGVRLKLHLEKTYFSSRLANERLRIAKQIKKGEEILIMFSGAGPYPLVLSKNSPANIIYGIEINPRAHEFAVKNIELNKVKNIIVYRGNVRTVLPQIDKKFDRIAMPLPKTSEDFLDVALPKIKKGGIIHLYSFLHEDSIRKEAKKIKEICSRYGKETQILRTIRCGSFSPGTFRICFDIKIKN